MGQFNLSDYEVKTPPASSGGFDLSKYAVPEKKSLVGNASAPTSPSFLGGSDNSQSFPIAVTDPQLKQQIQRQNAEPDKMQKAYDAYRSKLSPDEQDAFDRIHQYSQAQQNRDQLRVPSQAEIADQHAFDTPLGALAKSYSYLTNKVSKGGLQIAKGGAWIVNHMNALSPGLPTTGYDSQIIPDKILDQDKNIDKLTGITPTDEANIGERRNMGMSALRTGGMVAEIAPTILGGEVTSAPKAMFLLQGIGQGKETIDAVDPDKKLAPQVRDLFVMGSGLANAALMGDAAETNFAKMPAALRSKISTSIAMDAIKQTGDKELTGDAFKQLVNNGAKDFADKFYRLGTDYVQNVARTGVDLSALSASNAALKLGVNKASGQEVFNNPIGEGAEGISNAVLNQAPVFGALGSIKDVTKLTPYSNFKNDVIEDIIKDPSQTDAIKEQLAQHGQDRGWTPGEIDATNNHLDAIKGAVEKLPSTIKPEKKADAVQLVLDRDGLKNKLADETAKRSALDESVNNLPSQHEQYLTDKIDQANDKLRAMATGKKTTYSKPEEGVFLKTTNGVQEEIPESRYNLEVMERDAKKAPEPIVEQKGENTDAVSQSGTEGVSLQPTLGDSSEVPVGNAEGSQVAEESQSQPNGGGENAQPEEIGKPTEEQILDDLKNKRFATFKYSSENDIPEQLRGKTPTVNELTDKDGNVTKQYVITLPQSEADYLLQQRTPEQGAFDSMSKQVNTPNTSETPNQITVPKIESNETAAEKNTGSEIKATGDENISSNDAKQNKEQREEEIEPDNGEVKKTILTKRAYEGEIQPEVKKYLEEKGLTRKSFSQEERSKQATDFINKFGEESAQHAVESGDVDGGMAASILAQLQVRNNRAMAEFPEGSDERDALAKKQSDLIATMEKKGYLGGEFNGQLAHEYQNAELDYANVKKQVEDATGKKLTAAQDKKIKDLTDLNTKLKAQLDESEAKLIEASDREFKQDVVKKETNAERSKRIATKLRALKINTVNDATLGIPVALYNGAIETTASLIEGGGKIADAIDKGLERIRESDWYKNSSASKQQKTEQDFKNKISAASGSTDLVDLQERFVNKTDNKFSPDEARAIWGYIRKTYIENGTSYKDALSKTADDLGLSWRQVSEAVTTPKLKRVSDEMWKRQADLTRNRTGIKNWISDQNKSAIGKTIQKVSGIFRGVAVTGHAGIFIGTHAGMTLFNPSTWHLVIPAYLKAWKFAYGNTGEYERSMEELKNSPNYLIAQRAGLKNNPDRINAEEYQKSQKYLGKLGLAGERGFNAIKVLRQSLFDNAYNKLTPAERDDPEVAKSLAHIYNLATGATDLKLPSIVNEVTFAGGMEASRWQKLTQNPIKATEVALNAIFNPLKASTADRIFAKVWSRRVGEQIATYTTALLANAALQNSLNPTNPVNMTNPDKPDFLKFKFGDRTIDPTSGMRSTAMFIYKLGKIPFQDKKELHGDNGIAVAGKDILKYGRGKLSPFYGTLGDIYAKQDFNGNVMPFSSEKPSGYAHKLTWGEYAWEKAPLPAAEAAQDIYKSAQEHGADKKTLNNVLNGIANGAISGTTGVRVAEYDASAPENNKNDYSPTFDQIHLPDKSFQLNNDQLQERQKFYDDFMKSDGAKQLLLTIAKTTNAEEKKKLEQRLKTMASKVSKNKILQKYHNSQTGGYDLQKVDE